MTASPTATPAAKDRRPIEVLPVFDEVCQARNLIGQHGKVSKVLLRIYHSLAVRTTLRNAYKRLTRPMPIAVGAPSRFSDGTWVRILDEPQLRATLNEHGALRGLEFVDQQWPYTGGVFRVQKSVRRILDDLGHMRAIHRTAALEGLDCGGPDGRSGCGRHCALFFRDEWLEPADPPAQPLAVPVLGWARVRALEDIRGTLDRRGRLDGLLFMPEMASHAGLRFPVTARVTTVFELNRNVPTSRPFFVLAGLNCSGAVLGARGPCDRGCAMIWHERWIEIEPSSPAR